MYVHNKHSHATLNDRNAINQVATTPQVQSQFCMNESHCRLGTRFQACIRGVYHIYSHLILLIFHNMGMSTVGKTATMIMAASAALGMFLKAELSTATAKRTTPPAERKRRHYS